MENFEPTSSSKNSIIPANLALNKEEINLNDCLSNKNGAKDVTAENFESSIRCHNFKEYRECGFAATSSEEIRFQSGLITYKDPKFPKPLNLNPNIVSKDLQQLGETSNMNPTLSNSCSATGCNIDKLAVRMTEISIAGDNNVLSLEDLRQTLYSIFKDESLNHAEGHAASSYISDTLDSTSKMIDSDGMERNMKGERKFLRHHIERIARKRYSVTFDIIGATALEEILKEIVDRILEDTRNFVVNKDLQKPAVSKDVMFEVVQKLLSPEKFRLACSYAQKKFMKYSCGMLEYENNRCVEDIKLVPVETDEVEFTTKDILPDYTKMVQRLMMKEYHYEPDKGFLPFMNKILSDIGVVFTEMCCESARRNGNILSANEVFAAVNALLPERLRNNAVTRSVHYMREWPFRNNQFLADYGKAVQVLMMKEYHYEPDKGFLPYMNNLLNEIGVAFTEICCESAQRNGNFLSSNDILAAVHALLPERLRNNAATRILHEVRECPAATTIAHEVRECPNQNNQTSLKTGNEIEPVLLVSDEVEFITEDVLPDYREAVKRLMMKEYHYNPEKGFIKFMNNILNDIGVAFTKMCCESAQRNDNILSSNDILAAVNALLPERLRNNAATRIVHEVRECPAATRIVHDVRECPPRKNQTSLKTGNEIEPVPLVSHEVEFTTEDVLPDYTKMVQRLMMKEYHYEPDKGFLPFMNNILSDIGVAFAEMCSESAGRNDNVLSEKYVFSVMKTLLPERLRNNVFTRIVHEGRECILRNNQISSKTGNEMEQEPLETDEVEFNTEVVLPDNRKAVQCLTREEYLCGADERYLPIMNNPLNDMDVAFEEMCSESALRNDNILSENDVLDAVNILVRERLRNYDFTRIVHEGRESPSRKNKVKVSKRRNRSKSRSPKRSSKKKEESKKESKEESKKRRRRRRNRHRKIRSDRPKPTNADA